MVGRLKPFSEWEELRLIELQGVTGTAVILPSKMSLGGGQLGVLLFEGYVAFLDSRYLCQIQAFF